MCNCFLPRRQDCDMHWMPECYFYTPLWFWEI